MTRFLTGLLNGRTGSRNGHAAPPLRRFRLWPGNGNGTRSGPREEAPNLGLAELARPWHTRRQLDRLHARPRARDEGFRFAVLGDAEPGRFWIWRKLFNVPGVFETQVRRIQGTDVDFSMQLGDMVSRGIPRNYHRFFEGLSSWDLTVPYLTVIGNHDRHFPHGRSDSRLYRSLLGQCNYHFDRGPARFIALDSSSHRVTRRQLKWLDGLLDTDRVKIVFTHIPPAPLRDWTDFGGAKGLGGFKDGAEELVSLLSRRRVDRVYMGHIHGFGVQDFRGVRYVLTGGGGSPLYPCGAPDRFHHYLSVELGPQGLRETLHTTDGRSVSIPQAAVVLAR